MRYIVILAALLSGCATPNYYPYQGETQEQYQMRMRALQMEQEHKAQMRAFGVRMFEAGQPGRARY